ncbi:MAG: chorismate mutase [Clostridia bacterium]|nr:chorismate mutase [Clostridia bacterium]
MIKDLSECRREIDAIDAQLLKLLEQRIRVAESVARYKIANNMKVFDETREKAVLDKIGGLCPEDVRAELVGTYDGIMNMSKLHQYCLKSEFAPMRPFYAAALSGDKLPERFEGVKVGVQGVSGAYSEKAAKEIYPGAKIHYYKDWSSVFAALKAGEIEYGVLPVENSTYGSVTDVYRLIIDNDAYIVGSHRLPVEHCLLARPGVKREDVREILSHPQAIGQCAGYLSAHGIKATQASNTAVAAEAVASTERTDLAAIASTDCAELYGLEILERGIQDEKHNTTRFAAISRTLRIAPGADKISIKFSLAHREGTLSRVLGYFSALGLNLTKIESHPIPSRPFEYRFYVDFMGSMADAKTFDLLCALSEDLAEFRFIGNYHED